LNSIYIYINIIIKEFNDNLTALKEADPVIPEIGNEFIKISEKLKVYKEYCSNYPLALSLLRELSQRPEVKNLLVVMKYIFIFYHYYYLYENLF